MSAELVAILLIISIAPAQNAFVIVYAFWSPWWASWLGRAIFSGSLGLALLVDLSLAYQLLGDDYPGRDAVRLTVYSLIAAGSWMSLIVLLASKRRNPRRRILPGGRPCDGRCRRDGSCPNDLP